MKKILLLLTIFVFSLGQGQESFSADYVALYEISYKYLGKEDAKEQMLLFMNTEKNESFYECTNGYVLDSLITQGKIDADDLGTIAYDSNFNEKVQYENQQFTVFEKIMNVKSVYKEKFNIKWTITNETKKYDNVIVKKAYANVYGRKWYAWFTDNALPFGPYKFVGLPGLIMEMSDSNDNFSIKLTTLKKRKKERRLPNVKNFIKTKKRQIEKIRYGQKVVRSSNLIIHKDPKEKKERRNFLEKRFKNYPRLDIEFPYKY